MTAPVSHDQLRSIVERIERLHEDAKAISDDTKEVYAEAKANGFDTKAIRQIVKERADWKCRAAQAEIPNIDGLVVSNNASLERMLGLPGLDRKFARAVVYVLLHPMTGRVKIGITTNLDKRIDDLSRAGGAQLHLVRAERGNRQSELFVHERMSAWLVGREWFEMQGDGAWKTLQDAMDCVRDSNAHAGVAGEVAS